ncbi:MFS transporter [Plantactinospora sp. KBS50]|uniref:MFS transporter n=1 Tax=Plantactinospora sp. KBS50 TaxID=2024580 RepID=UPI0012FD52D2|nr:MFS transporter [Plantactinospora sp. KBS50]
MSRLVAIGRDRNAVLFIAISFAWGFGASLMMLVAGIWVLSLSGSSSLGALVGTCLYLPVALGPIIGGLVDRLPRRPLMVWTCLLTAAMIASLLAVRSAAEIWLIFVVMLGYGVSFVLLGAGESALLPAVLPAGLLGEVNGLRTSAQEGMKLVAPAIGAGLFTWRGGHPVVLLAIVALTVTAVLYAAIRIRPAAPGLSGPGSSGPGLSGPGSSGPGSSGPGSSGFRARGAGPTASGPAGAGLTASGPCGAGPSDAGPTAGGRCGSGSTGTHPGPGRPAGRRERGSRREYGGLRFLLGTPALRRVVLAAAACIAMSGITTAALYAAVVTGLHRSPSFIGVLASAQGLGSIVGGLLAGRLLAARGELRTAGVGALAYAAGVAAWLLPWWPGLVLGSVLVGIGLPGTLVAAMTAVQRGTPQRLLGRVSASAGTVLFAPVALANPIGAVLVLPDRRLPLLVVAAGALLTATVALSGRRTPRRPVERVPAC